MPDPPGGRGRFADIPHQNDDPIDWDASTRSFSGNPKKGEPGRDQRRIFIPAPGPGSKPPPAAKAPAKVAPARTTPPARQPPAPTKTGRSKRRWPKVVLGVVLVFLLLGVSGLLWANWKFGQIERVAVSEFLGGGSGTNYLIVGSDSREGITADDPNAGALIGEQVSGQRSDTLLILRLDGGGAKMLSIPRDLFVTIAETGDQTRINAAYAGGPGRLIQTIRDNLDIPIHRYLEVDFVSFAGLVDAVGGITLDIPNPAYDPKSGLFIPKAGKVELDGSQALAYVRSRNYIEVIDGVERTDPTADLGRVLRQQQFLSAVLDKVGSTKNPLKLMGIADSVVGGLKIDDDMTLVDALRLVWKMGSLDPQPNELPTEGFRTSAGASVLRMKDAEAQLVLEQFR